jgi:hypothetical protein
MSQFYQEGNNFFDLSEYEFLVPKYLDVFYYDNEGNKQEKKIRDGFKRAIFKPDIEFYLSGEYDEYGNYEKLTFSVNYDIYNYYYCKRSFSNPQSAIYWLLRSKFKGYKTVSGREGFFEYCQNDDLVKGFEREVVFCYGFNTNDKPYYFIVGKPNIRRLLTFDLNEYKNKSTMKCHITGETSTYWVYDKNLELLQGWFGENIQKNREERKLSIMIRRLAKCETVLSNEYEFQQKRKYAWH